MFAYLHRIIPCYYALLSILFGLTLAWAFNSITALYLDSEIEVTQTPNLQKVETRATKPQDNKVILERNIFNSGYISGSENTAAEANGQSPPKEFAAIHKQLSSILTDKEIASRPVKEKSNMELIGTIAGANEAIAVIGFNGEIGIYSLGDSIGTSAKVVKIKRLRVYIENEDKSISILELNEQILPEESSNSSAANILNNKTTPSDGIKQVNKRNWHISSDRAEQIRTNIATVVRQARVEPVVAQGQTRGFVVKYIQPGTLLTEMGLKRGDVIKQVNGITLDSPEKGLQVFQQLRESKSMDLSIERNNSPMTFKYEIR